VSPLDYDGSVNNAGKQVSPVRRLRRAVLREFLLGSRCIMTEVALGLAGAADVTTHHDATDSATGCEDSTRGSTNDHP
jgi:hypothetical protein